MAVKRTRAAIAGMVVAGLLALPAHASAETWVSFPALLHQVRTGDLIRAIINPARRDIEIKFRNLFEWHAYYPPGEQRELQRLLHARHVRTLFVPRRHHAAARAHPAVHHHLRYIAAGVLAALVLAGGGFLIVRRRSPRHPSTGS
ncbi:MAG TPA: hypothetical protein VH115_02400 [Solirubrobacteraceae bacterium]|nr:hypothetical protein [Solirubrobacteraceae bacterium]